MKSLLGYVILNKNGAKDEILLVLNDIVLNLKEMKNGLIHIEDSMTPNLTPSSHNPMETMLIKVNTSNSS